LKIRSCQTYCTAQKLRDHSSLFLLDAETPFTYNAQAKFALVCQKFTKILCIAKQFRVNHRINSRTVRLIGANDEQLGIKSIEDALQLAKTEELDLVEVAPTARPPVCKIMDFGKHLYKQKKLLQKQRTKQRKSEVKGVRLSLRTGEHDIQVKIKKARQFLEAGHSLKVALIFKGREISHFDLAVEKMQVFKKELADIAKVDQEPKKQGYNLFMILSPLK
jgi:translation initiation factor IF-3